MLTLGDAESSLGSSVEDTLCTTAADVSESSDDSESPSPIETRFITGGAPFVSSNDCCSDRVQLAHNSYPSGHA